MAGLDNLFGPHANNLQRAMGKATERQALLTANIANLNTPGYKRKDVDFSIVLEQKIGNGLDSSPGAQSLAERKAQRQADRTSMRIDKNNVDLEHEVMSIAETELRYQALTDMTASYFSGLKSAIREGR